MDQEVLIFTALGGFRQFTGTAIKFSYFSDNVDIVTGDNMSGYDIMALALLLVTLIF